MAGLAGGSLAAPVPFRDAVRRGSTGAWPAFCSNFFFMSLTVPLVVEGGGPRVAERSREVSFSVNLSSTGLDAER